MSEDRWVVIGVDPAIAPTIAVVEGRNRDECRLHDIYEGEETSSESSRWQIPREISDSRRKIYKKKKKVVKGKISSAKGRRRKPGIREPYPPFIRDTFHRWAPDLIVIENAWVMPGQGLASSAGFVGAARMVEGIAHGMGIPLMIARPNQWQPWFHVASVADDNLESYVPDPSLEYQSARVDYALRKERSRSQAAMYLPYDASRFSRKMDHNRAEAVLLALYGLEMLYIYKGDVVRAANHGFVNRQRLNLHYKDEEVVAL
jgi:hypothetical protein